MWAFQQKLEFWKMSVDYCELDRFPTIEDFFDEINGNINKCDFLILYYKMYQ